MPAKLETSQQQLRSSKAKLDRRTTSARASKATLMRRTSSAARLALKQSCSTLSLDRSSQALWAAVRAAVSSGLLRSSLMRVRAKRVSATFKPPEQTKLTVQSKAALEATPAWQQGDASLYSDDQVEARFRLRMAPEVQDALHAWWMAVLRSVQSGGDLSACTVGRERYVALGMSIYRQLVPGRVTSSAYQAAARCAAEADWTRDSKGRGALERSGLLDGLFELADHYVPTVKATEYASFLRELLHAVSLHDDLSTPAAPQLWREKPRRHAAAHEPTPSPPSPQKSTRQSPPATPAKSPMAVAAVEVAIAEAAAAIAEVDAGSVEVEACGSSSARPPSSPLPPSLDLDLDLEARCEYASWPLRPGPSRAHTPPKTWLTPPKAASWVNRPKTSPSKWALHSVASCRALYSLEHDALTSPAGLAPSKQLPPSPSRPALPAIGATVLFVSSHTVAASRAAGDGVRM